MMGPRSNAPPQGPRSYFTRGASSRAPGRPVRVAEVRAVPLPHDPERAHVELRVGGLVALTLNHVPWARLPHLEALVDCLHLGKVSRLLESHALTSTKG